MAGLAAISQTERLRFNTGIGRASEWRDGGMAGTTNDVV